MIENQGQNAVPVDAIGQIPSRFVQDVTGVMSYSERRTLVKDPRLRADESLAISVEVPKSLANVNKRRT